MLNRIDSEAPGKSLLSKFRSRDRSRDMGACARNIGRTFLRNTLRLI